MHKNTLWFLLAVLLIYLALVFCEPSQVVINHSGVTNQDSPVQRDTTTSELEVEGRVRKRHGLYRWGWHALAIAYWIKVKLVIIAFFVGSAIFVGLRYVWPNKCKSEIVREGSVVYDHGPSFYNHDQIPYSLDNNPSFGPYSSYGSSSFTDVVEPASAPASHEIKKRTVREVKPVRRPMATEEQIAEMMFYFLGLDSKACRRRFICEMEFRSRLHPLTSMAFRIVGRGFFEKYTNARNELGQAKSFLECAALNSECVFIEQNMDLEDIAEESEIITLTQLEANKTRKRKQQQQALLDENSIKNEVEHHDVEEQNKTNLKAEKSLVERRSRGDIKFDPLARRILAQADGN